MDYNFNYQKTINEKFVIHSFINIYLRFSIL